VLETHGQQWTLSLRVPAWSADTKLSVVPAGGAVSPGEYVRLEREWRAGDRVVLELDMRPRVVFPHPRIDAVRGCAAIERGPLVYCIEAADFPEGVRVDDLRLDPGAELRVVERPDLLGGIVALEASGMHHPAEDVEWPYGSSAVANGGAPLALLAIPYSHWGNRGDGGMRVWTPTV
jgi:uncharacterized protein